MQKKSEKLDTTSKSKNSVKDETSGEMREAFVLRLNGKIVPWAIVIFLILVTGRALVAEFRIARLEEGARDREHRVRLIENRPPIPNRGEMPISP